jgi:biopolymer transport protein ExbD
MARNQRRGSIQQITEINLTPLIDLTFILLITFIITFPLLEQEIPINLPKGDAAPAQDVNAQTITVQQDGRLALGDQAVSLEELALRMQAMAMADPDLTVRIRGDEAGRYGDVVAVMKVLHDARITRMAVVTQAETQ